MSRGLIGFLILCYLGLYNVTHAAQAPLKIIPLTPTTIQNYGSGQAVVNYQITNLLKRAYRFSMVPMNGVTQNTGPGFCPNPFTLQPGNYPCVLSLNIQRAQLTSFNDGPKICVVNKADQPGSFMCSKPSPKDTLKVVNLDPSFPYGAAPVGNVCVSTSVYATPETMLGSWAMLEAVALDVAGNVLPSFLNESNVVYAVGTAAIGNLLNIPSCGGGCNELNGYCFALKFNGKTPYPYMIFQSVNIGANDDSFDIYLAGGGSGAFPTQCAQFWGTGVGVNWANHIEDSSCDAYFGDYSSINSAYAVTYKGVVHTAKETLQNACTFASAGQSGFNTANWSNVSVVPVTCPQSLTQVTGLEIPTSVTTVGTQTIHPLSTLTDNDFSTTTIPTVTTTQMQDCKTPSSGFCGNVSVSVTNYEASISASLSAPLLQGSPPVSTYCQSNPNTQYCSWNDGQSSGGGSYCNANATQCIACGNQSKWCTCKGTVLSGCQSGVLG